MTGTIIRVMKDKGYGFIRDEEGMSRFFFAKEVRPIIVFDQLHEGQSVHFTPTEITTDGEHNGLRALDVRVEEYIKVPISCWQLLLARMARDGVCYFCGLDVHDDTCPIKELM